MTPGTLDSAGSDPGRRPTPMGIRDGGYVFGRTRIEQREELLVASSSLSVLALLEGRSNGLLDLLAVEMGVRRQERLEPLLSLFHEPFAPALERLRATLGAGVLGARNLGDPRRERGDVLALEEPRDMSPLSREGTSVPHGRKRPDGFEERLVEL